MGVSMSLTKQNYILHSLKKIKHKEWELYIISRILHLLNDDEIEFITQQIVKAADGSRYLTDIYFPQFNLHLEIDEPHHKKRLADDDRREQDIINETGHKIVRIDIPSEKDSIFCMEKIRIDVDSFIQLIRRLKFEAQAENRFSPWDFDKRYSAETHIKKGSISVHDNVVFKTQVEALKCFGFNGNGWQKGAWLIPDGSHDIVWFPRLYPHGLWHNQLADNGKIVLERATSAEGIASIAKQRKNNSAYPERKYIIFAKSKDVLGFNLLRFVGTFKMNFDVTDSDILQFDLISSIEPIRS
jgi:very-short-patch-repair endonuclease